MGQDTDKIAGTYNAVAMEYAEHFHGEHQKKPLDREILSRFYQMVRGRKPIWDFGCGPGYTTLYLWNLGIEVSGLDLSGKMVERARIMHPDIIFQKGNILDLEFESGSIAGIVAFYAIVHFSQAQVKKAFHEIFRVLEPGGIFLFTFHIGDGKIHLEEFLGKAVEIDFMFFDPAFILSSIKNAGFEDVEITERAPYPGIEYQSSRAYVFAAKPL